MSGRYGYGVGGVLLQVAALTGCDRPDAAAPISQPATTEKRPVPAAEVQGEQRLVLAFGDSLYAGYGLPHGKSLPDALQMRLRTAGLNATVVNAGVSGDTTAAGRRRLTFALDNLPRKPDLVLLGLGGNDVLRQISPEETRANLAAMLDELERRDVPVVLTGMQAPPNLGPEFLRGFNAIWPELAKRYNTALYPFILDGVIGNRALMLPDYVHPNAAGVERMADRLSPLVARQLQATALAKPS